MSRTLEDSWYKQDLKATEICQLWKVFTHIWHLTASWYVIFHTIKLLLCFCNYLSGRDNMEWDINQALHRSRGMCVCVFFFLFINFHLWLGGVLSVVFVFMWCTQALWLYRRFLSVCWMKHFAGHSHTGGSGSGSGTHLDLFVENEIKLFRWCKRIPDNVFEDYQAQAMFAATYIIWLIKVSNIDFVFSKFCSNLWKSFCCVINVYRKWMKMKVWGVGGV